jgi:hypothetical protein
MLFGVFSHFDQFWVPKALKIRKAPLHTLTIHYPYTIHTVSIQYPYSKDDFLLSLQYGFFTGIRSNETTAGDARIKSNQL